MYIPIKIDKLLRNSVKLIKYNSQDRFSVSINCYVMYITYYARLIQMHNRALEAATIEHFCLIFS